MKPELWTDSKFKKIRDPEWKRFEKLVARIHIALCRDAEVRWSERIIDTSGTERQIDVTIRTRTMVGTARALFRSTMSNSGMTTGWTALNC